ncbi:MAG: ATP-binding cassette domain-containing protein [Provencibacterium sp.]|jgi:ABC-2 type transport system ATP-binding protein|nr:ATP-binding cassette domain-containing protein [Provencibacterium sp.]
MALITAEGLTKIYRQNLKQPGLRGALKSLVKTEWTEKRAVDAVSFSMEEGESLACIGENGAGKSTLIKMLVGILTPTGGRLTVYGQNPMEHHADYLRKIGVVFGQKTSLWWDIPVIESYEAVKVLYKLDPALYEKNKRMVVELLDLEPILQSPARRLSLGQRMKADIGLVFLHSPRILYLDEPTIGLDINVKFAIRQFIRKMNQENGVSVVLTSHDLDDIEQICEHALVLSKGRVFYHGALDALKENYATVRRLTVRGRRLSDIRQFAPEASLGEEPHKTVIQFDTAQYSARQMLDFAARCYEIEDVTVEDPGIDYVVSKIFTMGAAK